MSFLTPAPLLAVGCLAAALLVVNNLRDRVQDAAVGKGTLAVRFGARFARRQYVVLLLVAYAVPVTVTLVGGGGPGWLLPIATAPGAAALASQVARRDGASLNRTLAATGRLGLAFGALLSVGVLL